MVGFPSLRYYINLIEGKKRPAPTEWKISVTSLFAETLKSNKVIFPDLEEKVKKFVEVKLQDPLNNRYGKHDRAFTGTSPLGGFNHAHLRDDAIIIYSLKNRIITLVAIVTHAEIEGNKMKLTSKKLAQFK